MTSTIHLLLADACTFFRRGVEAALAHEPDLQIIATATSFQRAEGFEPDIIMVNGLLHSGEQPAWKLLRQTYGQVPMAIVWDKPLLALMQQAMAAGVTGQLLANTGPSEAISLLRRIHGGEPGICKALMPSL